MKIIISGGGTGGHVFPAIAIADAIRRMRPDAELLFVGALGKIEMEKVPKAGYPIKGLWISGFHRQLTLRNLLFPLKLVYSLIKAWLIVRRYRPNVVVGVGGYASGPTLEAATRQGIPVLVQEQNSYAGVTNKLLAKKADRICVAYEHMERFFPKEKVLLTGNPVRDAIRHMQVSRKEAATHFGLQAERPTILVFGGSLGARSINQAMALQGALLAQHPEVQVLWQAGQLYYETYQDCEVAQLAQVQIRTFIDRMDLAYTLADVIVCRAGALTISEVCLVGKPTVLIPSPNVAEDHQTRNARALEEKKAAVLVPDQEAAERILLEPLSLLQDKTRAAELAANIKKLAKPDAAEAIAEAVIGLATR